MIVYWIAAQVCGAIGIGGMKFIIKYLMVGFEFFCHCKVWEENCCQDGSGTLFHYNSYRRQYIGRRFAEGALKMNRKYFQTWSKPFSEEMKISDGNQHIEQILVVGKIHCGA